MPFIRRRKVGRRVLLSGEDPRVGYFRLASVFELAHCYHWTRPLAADAEAEHHFYGRNFFPETLSFDRTIEVSGPATYKHSDASGYLRVHARMQKQGPVDRREVPNAGKLVLHDASGVVVTDVMLTPLRPHRANLPGEPVEMVSTYDIGEPVTCPCCE